MDWKTFIANIISSTAWPAAFVIVVVILKQPITKILSYLTKVKYKDVELEFSQAVRELRKETEEALPEFVEKRSEIEIDSAEIIKLAEVAPRAAVIEAWRKVDNEAQECLKRHDAKTEGIQLRSCPLERALFLEKIINEAQVEVIKELRKLRNTAVHADEFSFSTEDAIEYIFSAMPLVIHFRKYE